MPCIATWNWIVSAVMAALVAMASAIAPWVWAMAPALVVVSAGAVVGAAGEVTASGMVVLLQWWWAPWRRRGSWRRSLAGERKRCKPPLLGGDMQGHGLYRQGRGGLQG